MTSGVQGRVDIAQFRALAGKSSQLDPKIKRALRKNIKTAAEVAAKDVRATVQAPPASGGASGRHTGLRTGIAAGVKVTLMTGKKSGVAIRSTGTGLPDSQRKLVRAYDKPGGWRHPVFGGATWVQQLGRQYFESRIIRHRQHVTDAVTAAMREALKSLR